MTPFLTNLLQCPFLPTPTLSSEPEIDLCFWKAKVCFSGERDYVSLDSYLDGYNPDMLLTYCLGAGLKEYKFSSRHLQLLCSRQRADANFWLSSVLPCDYAGFHFLAGRSSKYRLAYWLRRHSSFFLRVQEDYSGDLLTTSFQRGLGRLKRRQLVSCLTRQCATVGCGGLDSNLFKTDLLKSYQRFAEENFKKWITCCNVLNIMARSLSERPKSFVLNDWVFLLNGVVLVLVFEAT